MSTRRATRTILLVACVIAVLSIAGVVTAQVTSNRGRRVLLIGDSITDQSGPAFTAGLSADYQVTVTAIGGARADERTDDLPPKIDGGPDRVVINLGTNDVVQNWPLDQSMRAIESIGSQYPAACVTLVTVNSNMYVFGDDTVNDRAAIFNLHLSALAARRDWPVARWDVEVRDYLAEQEPKAPLTFDSIHPTPLGQQHLTNLYRSALDGCD